MDCYILCERRSDFILIVHSEQYIGMHGMKGVGCQEAVIPCVILICARERERGGKLGWERKRGKRERREKREFG